MQSRTHGRAPQQVGQRMRMQPSFNTRAHTHLTHHGTTACAPLTVAGSDSSGRCSGCLLTAAAVAAAPAAPATAGSGTVAAPAASLLLAAALAVVAAAAAAAGSPVGRPSASTLVEVAVTAAPPGSVVVVTVCWLPPAAEPVALTELSGDTLLTMIGPADDVVLLMSPLVAVTGTGGTGASELLLDAVAVAVALLAAGAAASTACVSAAQIQSARRSTHAATTAARPALTVLCA